MARHLGRQGQVARIEDVEKADRLVFDLDPDEGLDFKDIISAAFHVPVLLRWLEEQQPDIVCLQELKAPDEKFPEVPIRDLGYDAIWHGQKSWNGVAILSRVGEIHETRRGLPGDPDPTQRGDGARHAGAPDRGDPGWRPRDSYWPPHADGMDPEAVVRVKSRDFH